ncbi:hapless 2 [Diabrotica virgifera virgifera]|uniref:Generative cell specific-1/HAP2 domain-containing protein n=1 Tax=Diabrotica virgifera virgifera TaxID=50390 RepID=A0ABM5KF59_DIAVI|nr:hapless 2 [Diabrotica virgifera virgifera]
MQKEQPTLTEEEKYLIKCCYNNLECCKLERTNFEVRTLLLKCQKQETDVKNREDLVTVKTTGFREEPLKELGECNKKLKLTIRIKNVGLTNCKNQYLIIDHAFDPITGIKQKLFNVYVLQIKQQPVLEIYGLCYEAMVNAEAKENVFNKNTPGYTGCKEGILSPCGIMQYEDRVIPYSDGFCCNCDSEKKGDFYKSFAEADRQKTMANGGEKLYTQPRGGQDCSDQQTPANMDPQAYHASSHCLKFSDLWYYVYRVRKPVIKHLLSVQIFQKFNTLDSGSKWRDLTKKNLITIGTSTRYYNNDDDSIIIRYIAPQINEADFGLNYNFHKILIPDTSNLEDIENHPEVHGGADEYLVVPSNKVQPNGRMCNVAGVGYEAFAKQLKACQLPRGSCLKNQPLKMWAEDNFQQSKGKKGKYFLQNYGVLLENTLTASKEEDKTLTFFFTKNYLSTLEMQIKDDDNTILRPSSLAALTEIYVDGTDSQKTSIVAKVFNSGLESSIFYIVLTECPLSLPASFSHIQSMPALIAPQHQHIFKLDIHCPLTSSNFICSLQVLNLKKELIAVRKIKLRHQDRCFCIWYCSCSCYTADYGLKCKVLSLLAYHAAGLQGGMPVSLQLMEYSFSDYLVFLTMYVIITLCLTLLVMGTIKALLGLCFIPIGIWGLDIILDLPRKINKYHENDISHMRVIYDEFDWPIHPVTGVRVRNIPIQAEFCINIMFFIVYPFCVFCIIAKSNFSNKSTDTIKIDSCYCRHGVAVVRKNSSLQISNKKPLNTEKSD